MGLWDKMFGRGVEKVQEPDAQQVFQQLRQKYQAALDKGDQERIQFQNLHVEGGKLYVKGLAPSEEARTSFMNQIEMLRAGADDVVAEITVQQSQSQAAAAGGAAVSSPAVTHKVESGDTLSKLSKEYYGTPDEYMRIFYANRDKLRDPNRINVGQDLVIPPDDNG
ncbi:MAG TPA: LysM peptidoglycan-binding domain-containing protein [Pyrinomonadaceae bacterium]